MLWHRPINNCSRHNRLAAHWSQIRPITYLLIHLFLNHIQYQLFAIDFIVTFCGRISANRVYPLMLLRLPPCLSLLPASHVPCASRIWNSMTDWIGLNYTRRTLRTTFKQDGRRRCRNFVAFSDWKLCAVLANCKVCFTWCCKYCSLLRQTMASYKLTVDLLEIARSIRKLTYTVWIGRFHE